MYVNIYLFYILKKKLKLYAKTNNKSCILSTKINFYVQRKFNFCYIGLRTNITPLKKTRFYSQVKSFTCQQKELI